MSQAAKDNNLCPRCHRGPLHTHQESGRCIVCAHLSDEDVAALQTAKQNAIFRPCPKCGCEKIKTGDCGYSSFNPGWAVCEGCGYKVSISICSGASDPAITTAWNEPALFEAKAAVAWLKEQVAERGSAPIMP